jgi:hypothetical protein
LKGVGSVSVRNGDIVDSAEIQAKRLSKPQRSYQISITDGSLLANVGDMVNVDVRNTNKYFDFKGEALINGKKILYENATKIISYSVGEFAVYPFTITKWQKELTKEIRLLRLKDMS